ncbi:MAG: hypothetical protein ACI8QC_002971 [Planctomycetota bacterium]|jgi:hypothetical protein
MSQSDFYKNQKFCPTCDHYVSYLQSVSNAYCIECGDEVRLFSTDDWESFNNRVDAKRPKGGRPKGSRGKQPQKNAAQKETQQETQKETQQKTQQKTARKSA